MKTWVVTVVVSDDCDSTDCVGVVEAETVVEAEKVAEAWCRKVEDDVNREKWEDFAVATVVSVVPAVRVA